MNNEITQEEKEQLLLEKVIRELKELPLDPHWAYSSNINYCIGMLEGFVNVKYKN